MAGRAERTAVAWWGSEEWPEEAQTETLPARQAELRQRKRRNPARGADFAKPPAKPRAPARAAARLEAETDGDDKESI